jgi:hypothetical protein
MIPLKTLDTYYIIPERSNTERGSEGPGLALSAGAHHIFAGEEDLGTSLLLCPSLARCLCKETKCSFLVMAYSALFKNVFEALKF